MADQTRGNGVEHAAKQEAAAASDGDEILLEVRGAARRQCLEQGPLDLQFAAAVSIGTTDDLSNEPAVEWQIGEVAAAAQQQRLLQGLLGMAMTGLNGAVLVRDTSVIAGGDHAVMRTKSFVALGLIPGGIAIKIAERRRKAVAAMFVWRTAERPQGILQSLSQGNEAFTAEHHFSMLPAGERQPEVIEPVGQADAGDGDAERVGVGEVRQTLLFWRVHLTEDHVAFRPVHRLPDMHPALQGAAGRGGEIAMPTQHLAHDADRTQPGAASSSGTISLSQIVGSGSDIMEQPPPEAGISPGY